MLTLALMPVKHQTENLSAVDNANQINANTDNKLNALLKWAPLIVIVLTAATYSRALFNDFVFYDDDIYVLTNTYIKDCSLNGIKAIATAFYMGNYHPLTMLVYMAEYAVFGLNPLPYHAIMVAIHLVNVYLVFKLVGQLSGNRLVATLVCGLFALHPMHVESVAWISETKDMLYALFYLWGLTLYMRYIAAPFSGYRYTLLLFVFIAALLSKSAAVSFPVLLLAIDVYKQRKITKAVVLEKVPLLLLSIMFGIINIYAQRDAGALNDLSLYFSMPQRFFLLTHNLAYYLVSVFVPVQLCSMHFIPVLSGGGLPVLYYLSAPLVGVVAWLVMRKSAMRRELIFGMAFFLISISVMLQIVSVGSSLTAERYTYISYIGLFYIVGCLMVTFVKNKSTATLITGISLTACALLSWNRIGAWKDSDANFKDVIAKNPGNPNVCYAYWSLGNAKKYQDSTQAAGQYYIKAIMLNNGFSNAYASLGQVYQELGDTAAAMLNFNTSLRINPKLAVAYNYRGMAYAARESTKAAFADYDSALILNNRYAAAYCNRGAFHYKVGNKQAATEDLEQALNLDPDYAPSYNYRGQMLFANGNKTDAIDDFTKAIALKPTFAEAYFNRGWAYYATGNTGAATADYTAGIAINQHNAQAYYNLASIKANTGDLQAAYTYFTECLKIDSTALNALNNRGVVSFNLKDTVSACSDWTKAAGLGNQSAKDMLLQYCK